MRTPILIAAILLVSTFTLVATAPSASACTPPNCPGFGGCHLTKPTYDVDPESATVTLTPPHMECYY